MGLVWLVGCYYNVIIAWCLYYLGSSFTVSRNKIIFLIQFLNVAIADLLLVTYYLSKQNKNYRFAGIFFYTICTVCRMFTSLVSFSFNPTLIVLQKVCVNSYENSRRYLKFKSPNFTCLRRHSRRIRIRVNKDTESRVVTRRCKVREYFR